MGRYYITICSANMCYNSSEKYPNKSYFPFPRDVERCRQWLDNCGRTDLSADKVIRANGYYNICEDHFEEKYFTNSSRTFLNKNMKPTPTIFVNNIRNLCPPLKESEGSSTNATAPTSNNTNPQCDLGLLTYSETESIHYIHNLNLICRFCANELQDEHIEIFRQSHEATEIRQMFYSIISHRMEIHDRLPQKACQSCVSDLKTCYRLLEQFKKSDTYLRTLYGNLPFAQTEENRGVLNNIDQDINDLNQDGMTIPLPNSYALFNNLECDLADAGDEFREEIISCSSNKECTEKTYTMFIENIVKDDFFCEPNPSLVNTIKQTHSETYNHSKREEHFKMYPLLSKESTRCHEKEDNPTTNITKTEEKKKESTEIEGIMNLKYKGYDSDKVILNNKDDLQIRCPEKPIFRCSLCHYSFTRDYLLDKHKCRACETCGKVFSSLKSRIRHEEVKYPCCSVKEICWICGVIIKGSGNFRKHLQSHDRNIPNCDKCYKSFRTVKELYIHKQIHYPQQYNRDYLCEFCSKRFTDYNNLLHHLKISHKNKKIYSCNLCTKHFNSKMIFLKHRKVCSAKKEQLKLLTVSGLASSVANITCNICLRKFVKTSSLCMHRIYHFCDGDQTVIKKLLNEPEINMCDVCDKLFYSKTSMLFHRRKHTKDTNPIKCEICDVVCDSHLRMTLHLQQHIIEHSFKCFTCGRSFSSKYFLAKHRMKHYKTIKKSTQNH